MLCKLKNSEICSYSMLVLPYLNEAKDIESSKLSEINSEASLINSSALISSLLFSFELPEDDLIYTTCSL